MSTRYDAWSELPAPLAEALRSSLYTGDWSQWDPEVVDAFRRALDDGDWSAFDPQTAATIRAAIGQETVAFEARQSQERTAAERKADLALAAEMRELASRYSDFSANAKAILELAVRGSITDLDSAYRTWRSSTGHDGPALAGQPDEPSPIAKMEARVNEIRAELEGLGHGALGKRSQLKFEMEDLQDKIALALMRGANANLDQGLRDTLDAYQSARSTRIAGPDKSRVSKEEKRAQMDLEALDLISGRTRPPTSQRKSSAERAAELNNFDALDKKAYAQIHGESIGEPEITTPNAEAVLQESTE